MSRKHVNDKIQARVLTRSRRRCCICYGLNRDTGIKQGQIAHIDKDSSNAKEDNLVFLCIPCHDRYDSTTRQSKNVTASELIQYRDELDQALTLAFSQPTSFGEAVLPKQDSSVAHFIRIGDTVSSAELTIHRLTNGEVRVVGEALWGTDREFGPNIGTLDFLAPIEDEMVYYEQGLPGSDQVYKVSLSFMKNGLVVEESGSNGFFGMNVRFTGTYARAT